MENDHHSKLDPILASKLRRAVIVFFSLTIKKIKPMLKMYKHMGLVVLK